MKNTLLRGIIFTTLAVPFSLCAEESETLLGDWGGVKPTLEDHGVSLEAVFTADLLRNASGGVSRGTDALYNVDITATIDSEKAGLWSNGTFFFYGLGNFGDAFSERVGDSQVVSNIETAETLKLYEAWYEHVFPGSSLSVLAGLHDYNSEFYALDYAGSLFNSSFGIGIDTSQVGPSIFSTTAVATRVRYQPSQQSYLLAAIYDGVPGDPNDDDGTHIILRSKDGLFYAAEVGFVSNEEETVQNYYKLALGGWYHTTDFTDYKEEEHAHNFGSYLVAEATLLSEEDPSQGLGGFIQFGVTRADRNEFARYLGAGLTYTGAIPGRNSDITTIGVAHAMHGSHYNDMVESSDRAETVVEFNYRAPLFLGITVQPDFQYIVNPGTDSALDNAFVFGSRFELVF